MRSSSRVCRLVSSASVLTAGRAPGELRSPFQADDLPGPRGRVERPTGCFFVERRLSSKSYPFGGPIVPWIRFERVPARPR